MLLSQLYFLLENPVNGLRELFRVLKSDGQAFFLEHILPKNRILRAIFNLLNPVLRTLGPEINRKTDENIKSAGFELVKEENLFLTVFWLFKAVKPIYRK